MNKKGRNAIAAIIGIVILTCYALSLGHDGILYLTAIGIISGLGGYVVLDEITYAYGNIGEAIQEIYEKRPKP